MGPCRTTGVRLHRAPAQLGRVDGRAVVPDAFGGKRPPPDQERADEPALPQDDAAFRRGWKRGASLSGKSLQTDASAGFLAGGLRKREEQEHPCGDALAAGAGGACRPHPACLWNRPGLWSPDCPRAVEPGRDQRAAHRHRSHVFRRFGGPSEPGGAGRHVPHGQGAGGLGRHFPCRGFGARPYRGTEWKGLSAGCGRP